MAQENIKSIADLNAEIANLKASIQLQEKLLEHKWERLPAESIKVGAGAAIPFVIKRLVSNTSTNIIADVFSLLFSGRRNTAKKAIGGAVKRIGLITILKGVVGSWTKKKFSAPH